MKRLIIAIAALGMIAPVAALAAPVAKTPAANVSVEAQTQKRAAQKKTGTKVVKDKKNNATKTNQSSVKKTTPKQVKK